VHWLVVLALLMAPMPARTEDGPPRVHPPRYAQAAVDGRVSAGSTATLVPFGTMTAIIVWRSAVDMDEGFALAKSNASTIVVLPLVSCVAESGSKVVIGETGSSDNHYVVTVTTGSHAGCQGVVPLPNVRP
jgi:hypothetical protein